MGLYLAADAGGTRTTFVLADDTRELARAVTGTIKRMRADAATTTLNLENALAELTLASGRSLAEVTRTCIGAAGYTVPLVVEWLQENIAARVAGDFLLAGDVEIALDAAFQGRPGLLLLSGTGSNVAGRLPSGEIITAGGWGPALSDQASGYGIGRAGLRAAVLEYDEARHNPHTHPSASAGTPVLLQRILDLWHLPGFQALVDHANRQPSPDLSRLAPLVVAEAAAGNPVALDVLATESAAFTRVAATVLRRLAGALAPPTPIGIAFAGSILEHVPAVRDHLLTGLAAIHPHLAPLPGVVDPVLGALWRARHPTR